MEIEEIKKSINEIYDENPKDIQEFKSKLDEKFKEKNETQVFNYGTLNCNVNEIGWLCIVQFPEQTQGEQIISIGKSDGQRFKTLKKAIEEAEKLNLQE